MPFHGELQMNKTTIMITTAKGLEKFLMEEVKALGLPVTWAGISGVKTEGSFTDAMRLNLHLRTGHRVLFQIKQCTCANPDELYKAVNSILWETMIPADGYVSVVANVVNDTVKDTRFAGLKCKDAIVDRIFRHKGRRPDSGPLQDRAVVNLFWRGDRCEIYLDTSGEPLSKRGYRKRPMEAPLQETLAAGIVLASGWDGSTPFINPMCGSGTLAIEAALIAANRAPGLGRQSFGFMHTLKYDKAAWQRMRDEARAAVKKPGAAIVATDIRREAVEAAVNNAKTSGVDKLIEFSSCDFADTPLPEGRGVVVLNPEYGLRMGKESELAATYRRIGDFFKQKCAGRKGYVFTGNTALAGKVGLKSDRRMTLWSGDLECKLYEYGIY
jgi:putative N6-adenine-specific DNA methylase